jgi:hypothetical protein
VSAPRSRDGALLAGLLRCAGCRYVMKPDTMVDRNGTKLRLYRCRGDHAAGRCPAPTSVLGRVIEPEIERRFLAELLPGGILARGQGEQQDLDDLLARVADAERELEAWVTEPALSSLGRDLYIAGMESRQRAVDDAHEALAEASRGSSADLLDADLGELWPGLPVAERRRFLAAGIDAIMLRRGRELGDRLLVFWQGDGPDGLPSRGRRVPLTSFTWPDDAPGDAGVLAA